MLSTEYLEDMPEEHQGMSGNLTGRCKWADGEVETFFDIIRTLKLQSHLKTKRNDKVFKLIVREMNKRGYQKKPDQLKIKYHQLRRQYARAKSVDEGSGLFEHFEALHELVDENRSEQEMENDSSAAEIDEVEEDANMDSEEREGGDAGQDDPGASSFINARCKWAEGEVDVFLDLITSMGLQTALLRKRNAKIFKLLSKEMSKKNYIKGPDKLRIKFQLLRRLYNKVKNGSDESFEHFEAMRKVLDPTEEEAAMAEGDGNFSSSSDSEFNDSDDEDNDFAQRGGAHFWSDEEVDAFLLIIKENGFFRALDGSRKRNFKTLIHISQILAKQSYKRTPHQLRNKLRLLIKRYREAKKNGLSNVRILPRHFDMFEDLYNAPKTQAKKSMDLPKVNTSPSLASKPLSKKFKQKMPLDSDLEQSSSSCDLLRAAAAGESDYFNGDADGADTGYDAGLPEPSPLEVLTAINKNQKQLLAFLKTSNDNFLRQQQEQQRQFLQEMATIMRQDREENFRMLAELITSSK
ncbi:uncharacterized protein Dwil_GK20739, isoform A [Drosophila willistoni]|uniref:Uncharacterized protein, isoform A n=3 Tax=Drosophila willistoni TaxID=7260 RepID=B4MJV6_DROWI|nr:uncharacterized protein Dwil_GK20739, isoform A [Drosophila willistoni]